MNALVGFRQQMATVLVVFATIFALCSTSLAQVGGELQATFDRSTFGKGWSVVWARRKLQADLQDTITGLAHVGKLTDAQKQKLQLAGRGDIERCLERIESLRQRIASPADEKDGDGSRRRELEREIESLRILFDSPFSDESLFRKLLSTTLSAEQFARYEARREIQRVGGRIATRPQGTGAGLEVRLENIPLTDESLARVKGLATEVVAMHLAKTQVTDTGLAHLAGMSNLQTLDLSNTNITDSGLVHLEKLRSLQTLTLYNTRVTGSGLASLKGLTSLRQLSLGRTRVDDAGLADLSRLKSLLHLDLADTKVTDGGLAHLRGLADLRHVVLRGTEATATGVADLKMFLPRVNASR